MKVILTGGGTAGHVNPALAIAQIISKDKPDCEIAFIGTKKGLEGKLVPKAGYPFHEIEVMGLRRSLSLENIKVLYKAWTSYRDCKKILKEFRPDAVIGTGGYVSWPVCRAAAALKIPTFLHESNAEPGFAVKMLKNQADVIWVNFEDTRRYLAGAKAEIMQVGMPINRNFGDLDRSDARKIVDPKGKYRHIILSFGGSLGAKRLNDALLGFMSGYMKAHPDILLIHAAGARNYEEMKEAFDRAGLSDCENIRLSEYIYDMPTQMLAADLVICRSGASTLSELAAIGKASILVPSPNVTNNQQYKNASLLADKGAALLIEDAKLTADLLAEKVDQLLSDQASLEKMRSAARLFAVGDTEEKIIESLKSLVNRQ